MNRHFRNISIAIASGAVLAVAGAVIAEVPDNSWFITDDKEPVTEGYFRADGDEFEADAWTECAPFQEGSSTQGSYVEIYSYHPDGVQLKKEKGEVEQGQKDNTAVVYLETGSGEDQIVNYLSCDKADVSSNVKTKKSPNQGSFKGSAKDCVCDEGDCGDYPAQIAQLAIDCADLKSIKGDFKDGVLKKLKIKGKGDAEVD